MFTLKITYRENRQEEFIELDESFKIIPVDGNEEQLDLALKQFPDSNLFIVSTKYTIPVLRNANYEILNSKGNVIKTLY